MHHLRTYVMAFLLALATSCHGQGAANARKEPHYGFAPPDAFLPGSPYPFYGNEEGWNFRAFTSHIVALPSRRGQRQMFDIVQGKPDQAARYCRELLANDPNDLESL